MVSPVKVDASGYFLSYTLYHHASNIRRKRDFWTKDSQVYYKIKHKEKDLFFNLTLHQQLLSQSYILERRYGNYSSAKITPRLGTSCHLIGNVLEPDFRNGKAVISTCNGLVSSTDNFDFFMAIINFIKHKSIPQCPESCFKKWWHSWVSRESIILMSCSEALDEGWKMQQVTFTDHSYRQWCETVKLSKVFSAVWLLNWDNCARASHSGNLLLPWNCFKACVCWIRCR